MSELCNCFGLTVRQLREAHFWSQEVLAERADLNRSYVGEIERGKVIPSLVTMDKLASALKISMPDLLTHCEQLRRSHTSYKINLASYSMLKEVDRRQTLKTPCNALSIYHS